MVEANRMTTDNIANVLASLAATYAVNDERPIVIISKPKAEKVAKSKKSDGSQAAPKNTAPKAEALPINMPLPGTVNASQFLIMLRDCGKRSVEAVNESTGEVYQKPIFDNSLVREDTIRAIASYIGYNAADNFGAQEVAARSQAQREIRGIVPATKPYSRSGVSATVKGYVAGVPDDIAKRVADLQGRAQLAVQALTDHERNANDETLLVAERQLASTLAAVEQERLNQIRKDLAILGF